MIDLHLAKIKTWDRLMCIGQASPEGMLEWDLAWSPGL